MWEKHERPIRETTGFTPIKKLPKREEALHDVLKKMEDVSKELFKEAAEEERDEHGGGPGDSPGSTLSSISTSSREREMAEKLVTAMNAVEHVTETLEKDKEEKRKKEEEDIEEKEKKCFEITDELDGSVFASYDDPVKPSEGSHMSKETRRLYQEHLQHNIIAVCEAFKGDDSVPITKLEKQCGNYFSRHPRGLVIGHYPPSSQCGAKTNMAVTIHKSATIANEGKPIFRLKSACIARQAHLIAQGMGHNDSFSVEDDGDRTYEFKYVACSINPDRVGNVRLIKSAALFLSFDFIDRHPTFNDNKVNPEKLIDSNSKLGYQHRLTGDVILAKLVKSRQADIAKANGNIMGPPTNALPGSATSAESPMSAESSMSAGLPTNAPPVMVWNAGRVKSDSERTGAQAALFETLIKEIIEQLFGIFHPEYLMWTKNLLVQVAAEETDLEICRFIEASGGKVRVDDAFRKFVGVAECTPQERERMERECSEAMSALSMLAWMSQGRPGSKKNEFYRECFKKTEDEELSANLAQQQVMFDGAREAAARFAGLTPEEVAELDEEGVRGLIEAHRYDGLLRAAARSQNISWVDVEGMTQNKLDDMVKAYIRAGQIAAAAKSEGIFEQQLAHMDDTQKKNVIRSHIRKSTIEAAVKKKGIDPNALAQMTKKELDDLINDHTFDGQTEAAKSWAREQKVRNTSPFTSLPLVASTQQQQQSTAVERFLMKLSEEKFESMDKDTKNKLLKDLVEEYKHFSVLKKACVAFNENFDEAKGDSWKPQERRDIIERYKFLSRAESLGYSFEAVKGMSPEMRREVKHKYNKKLLLSKLGIEADDGSDDDGDGDGDDTVDGKENLTYAEGMEMTIEEIQTLIVKREGGMTTQQAIRETFALVLGLTEDRIKGLSPEELDKIRVIRLQKGRQEKNRERGVFHLPGTSEHKNVVKDICIALRAYGLLILSEQIESLSEQIERTKKAKFLNDWAFKIRYEEVQSGTRVWYKVYHRAVFEGVENFKRLLDDVLCLGAKKNWRAVDSTLTSITQYIYHKRGTFFKGTISRPILDALPAKNLSSSQLGQRTYLQRRIEQNKDRSFQFAGDYFFDTLLEQLATESRVATFYSSLVKNKDEGPWWIKRVCFQRTFSTRESGAKRPKDYLYYQDDSGSWLGPNIQWDIVPGQEEKMKNSHVAIVDILNALDNRFENVPVANGDGEEEESIQ